MIQIKAETGSHSYPIVIEKESFRTLPRLLKLNSKPSRCFIVFDANVYVLYGKTLLRIIKNAGIKPIHLVIPPGESSKSYQTIQGIHDFLLSNRISRDDLIIACGGGVTSDIVGFAAGTILRGVKWGVISTTLLGMVDAAIGGKTGINHQKAKNAVGVFHQPEFVYSHLPFLPTLPKREWICGLGEILKYGGLIGGTMINDLDYVIERSDELNNKRISDLIAVCSAYKAEVVAADERDNNVRMYLNFGHTFAHGIETSLGYGKLLHGESVILGIHAALNLSELAWPKSVSSFKMYRTIIEQAMQLIPKRKIKIPSVIKAMNIDKKRVGTSIRFVLLEKPGKPIVVSGITELGMKTALRRTIDIYK